MKKIKNSEELAKLVDKNKDLRIDENLRIEFEPTGDELRNVHCRDLFLMNGKQRFDFNGNDFIGYNFNGHDFNGHNFYGHDFNGNDFNGNDFIGYNFNGHNFNGHSFNGYYDYHHRRHRSK